jgi:hypothetical protein
MFVPESIKLLYLINVTGHFQIATGFVAGFGFPCERKIQKGILWWKGLVRVGNSKVFRFVSRMAIPGS